MTDSIRAVFERQQKNKYALRFSTARQRISKLQSLKSAIEEFEEEIYAALQSDLRKSKFESAVTEVIFIYSEIDFAIKNLKKWMRPVYAGKSIASLFAKNRICYEPKGLCLIISPWNYPFQLMMSPLTSSIAAGNCAILKPSEFSPATSAVIAKIVEKVFSGDEIACFQGDQLVSEALLQLPFDHIFFTGSTAVGKVVMRAAAEHLGSVTLELGGKSPVVVDETANIKNAAAKIAWGKLVNAGQTCIAPDHVFIHRSKLDEFISYYKSAAAAMFLKDNGEVNELSYAKIINRRHADRLIDLINDAVAKGGDVAWGGEADLNELSLRPTLLCNLPADSKIMEEEIFGPILPVIPFDTLQVPIESINKKNKPLALYIFSESKANIKHLLTATSSGGACVNDVLIHISNPNLPFGGVNASGIGSCHGIFGFKTFSHERSVVFQSSLNMSSMIYPPYTRKDWVLKVLGKLM